MLFNLGVADLKAMAGSSVVFAFAIALLLGCTGPFVSLAFSMAPPTPEVVAAVLSATDLEAIFCQLITTLEFATKERRSKKKKRQQKNGAVARPVHVDHHV